MKANIKCDLPEKSDKELDQIHDAVVLREGNLLKKKKIRLRKVIVQV